MDSVEEIKQKLDIADVVGEYVQLKRAGINFRACCPFHNEKTPSFFVSPERQSFHCFGCNEGGDMFSFVQKIEGVEFPEALRILAQKAGVVLQQFDPRANSLKNRLQDVGAAAARFWQQCLGEPVGQNAREYVRRRKISAQSQIDFKIGYAPDSWDLTLKHLRQLDFNETEIFQAGLTVKKEKGTGYYDRFRDRLMFPIQDLHGNVIGFTGRALKTEELAKYVNTPEGSLYHKGKVLYGLDKAKQAIRKIGYAIVVEGNMDALTCHEAGYKNVVACSGTALTPDQILLIKRYTDNIALCFDEDEAGQTAAKRTIDLVLGAEMNCKVIHLLSGKDPDECIRKNSQDWEESLKQSKSVMQFYFDKYLTDDNLREINKKKSAAKNVLTEIAKLKDKIEQDHWIKKLAEILSVKTDFLWESLPGGPVRHASTSELVSRGVAGGKKHSSAAPGKLTEKPEIKPPKSKQEMYFERIMTILLNNPALLAYAQEFLPVEMVHPADQREFYKSFILFYNKSDQKLNREQINQWLSADKQTLSQGYLNSLVLYIDEIYEGFTQEKINQELIELINSFKIDYWERKIELLNNQLKQAEKAGNRDELDQIIRQIKADSEQLMKLK